MPFKSHEVRDQFKEPGIRAARAGSLGKCRFFVDFKPHCWLGQYAHSLGCTGKTGILKLTRDHTGMSQDEIIRIEEANDSAIIRWHTALEHDPGALLDLNSILKVIDDIPVEGDPE